MHPRARRAISVALSVAVHLLLLINLYTVSVLNPSLPEDRPLPVKILEPSARQRPAPKAPPQPPPPQLAAKPPAPPPEEAKPIEEPPPPAPAPEPPQRKLPLPEQQIVTMPDAGKNEAPEKTRLLSDRDNRVDQQTVKRGNPAPGESVPNEPPAPKPPAAAKQNKPAEPRGGGQRPRSAPPRVASLPGLDRLMPNALRLAEEGYGADAPAGEQVAQADRPRPSERRGGDGMWIPSAGPIGTLDFLPDVREGDITLLNTKAEVFAPFVRRVALRVFQNFWISLKRDLVASSLPATEQVEAEVIMSPNGEMVGFTINQRSARIALASDRRLQQACSDAFFDRNPPPGARAKDGRIHFVFRTGVQSQPSPRGTAYWVELEAGLL